MTTTIQIKHSGGITLMPIETRLFASRTVFVSGEINFSMADDFKKQIIYLNRENPDLPIDLWIDSPGGEIGAGLSMYDMIQSSPAPIRMICCGTAASMAAILFASGQHGRYMFEHSELMIHEPLLGGKIGGNTSSIKSISENLQATKQKMNRILAKHTGRTEEEIDEATSYDHYMTPEEAIAFGLCDAVTDLSKVLEV